MNRFINKSLVLVALVGAMTAYSTGKAEAAFTLEVCNDAACAGGDDQLFTDANLDGFIGTLTTFNGMEIILAGALSKPSLADGMDLNFQVNNQSGGPASVWIKATDTGFAGQGLLSAHIGGTSDSGTVLATVCQVVGGCTNSGLLAGNPYSATWAVGPAGSDPYTMSLLIGVENLVAGTTASGDFLVVPEPITLSLLGLGLAGVAARRRRQVQ
jgi:hypothetical protein